MLDVPVMREYQGVMVVRDDLLPGGTKRRALVRMLMPGIEYVYASPGAGYAQLALAYACADVGAAATVFTAKRAVLHPLTTQSKATGATVRLVPTGYLSNVQAKAKAYSTVAGATYLPFGLDTPEMRHQLAVIALELLVTPKEVWTVAGSGTLTRSLQQAWPLAQFMAIRIGKACDVGRAMRFDAPERFEQPARMKPPFPSSDIYDAKAWQFITKHASPGALFWNVGG